MQTSFLLLFHISVWRSFHQIQMLFFKTTSANSCFVCDSRSTTTIFATEACQEIFNIQKGLLNIDSEKLLYLIKCKVCGEVPYVDDDDFCGMVDRRKAYANSLISSRDHCQRSSPSQIFDTPRAGCQPVQNLSSGFVEWSCAVAIITTLRRQQKPKAKTKFRNRFNNYKSKHRTFRMDKLKSSSKAYSRSLLSRWPQWN